MNDRSLIVTVAHAGLCKEPANLWRLPAEIVAELAAEIRRNVESLASRGNKRAQQCTASPGWPVARPLDQHRISLPGKLAVLTCFFNPCGWRSRRRNYDRFRVAAEHQGADVITIEAAMLGEPWQLEEDCLRVRMRDLLWQKERLLNLALESLPAEYDKVAWVDCDLLWDNTDWVAETCRRLERWHVLQLFSEATWLNRYDIPDSEGWAPVKPSIPWAIERKLPNARSFATSHPGFAWAARRSVLDQAGFYDRHILGSGDCVMVLGFYGMKDHVWCDLNEQSLRESSSRWADAVFPLVNGNVGYVPGLVRHLWHGSRQDRRYDDRLFKLTVGDLFDCERDLQIGADGCYEWSPAASAELRKTVADYFAQRREDG